MILNKTFASFAVLKEYSNSPQSFSNTGNCALSSCRTREMCAKKKHKKTTYSKISGCGGYRPTFAVFNEI
ncbi:hypothetical protein HY04_02740 [Kaistella antarctica]|uniref:Uncharacterized protein n=1 Tax=Kaistella antarctica TaxID=266748 RepID=A0ABR4U1T1_9FLAO|nr:hypothetical protein HY04_02740 [Kaistella antarctica]